MENHSSPVAPSKIVVPGNSGEKVTAAVTVLKTRSELYTFWRHFENLPRVIKHPVRIEEISSTESLWTVTGRPGDKEVSWTALVINDVPDSLIAWRTADGAEVPHAGTIRFEDGPPEEGTEVTITLEYDPPGGKLGSLYAKLIGKEPGQQVKEALRRLKALMEAGEIPSTEGQSVGGPQAKKNKKGMK